MADVEYTEKALDHLGTLDPQVADRVMNKVDEATDWTAHRLEPLLGTHTTNSAPAITGRSSARTERRMCFGLRPLVTGGMCTTDTSRPNRSWFPTLCNTRLFTGRQCCTRLGMAKDCHVVNISSSVNRAIADEGGICRQLAILDATSGVNASLQSDGSIAVSVVLGSNDTPESTIELEYGNVTDYELYVGPYISEGKFSRSVLARQLRDALEHHGLFPNGSYKIHRVRGVDRFTVEFAANLLFSQRRESRSVEAVVGDIKTLLDLRESL